MFRFYLKPRYSQCSNQRKDHQSNAGLQHLICMSRVWILQLGRSWTWVYKENLQLVSLSVFSSLRDNFNSSCASTVWGDRIGLVSVGTMRNFQGSVDLYRSVKLQYLRRSLRLNKIWGKVIKLSSKFLKISIQKFLGVLKAQSIWVSRDYAAETLKGVKSSNEVKFSKL